MKNINVQTLQVNEKQFFKMWLILLQSFLKLRDQELDLLAMLLYYRNIIKMEVKSKVLIDELLFNTQTRKKIQREMGIKSCAFNNLLTALRKKNMIVDNSLNPKIIPIVENDFKNFKFVYNIEIKD